MTTYFIFQNSNYSVDWKHTFVNTDETQHIYGFSSDVAIRVELIHLSKENLRVEVRRNSFTYIGVGLVISRSLVQFPAGALSSVLWQDSLFHIASVYPAAKWVPSINRAVLRACALYAANCSRKALGGLKSCSFVQAC